MLKPIILITRPEPQATITAAQWNARGYNCIISPVIMQNPVAGAGGLLEKCATDAFVLTSGYALKLLAQHSTHKHLLSLNKPLYVTGKILANQACKLGFKHVEHGNACARSLLDYMAQNANKSINYACLHSNHQAVNMVEGLQGLGFRVQGVEIYQTHPVKHLSAESVAALQAGDVAAVLLYSAMSAQSFLHLINVAGLQHNLTNTQAICLSENIANAIPAEMFGEIVVMQ